jgi:hypothetical protein
MRIRVPTIFFGLLSSGATAITVFLFVTQRPPLRLETGEEVLRGIWPVVSLLGGFDL